MYKEAAFSEHPSYSEENLRIIFVEDVVEDAALVHEMLERSGLSSTLERVDTEAAFLEAIGRHADVILCDFSLPSFDGMTALQIAKEKAPAIPFIFVSGTIGEELAIQALRFGAYDYVLKNNIARLPSSVRRALQESHERSIRRRTEEILSAESNLLSTVFDTAGAIGVMLDAEGRILRFNQAGEKSTGYASENVLGLCFWDIFFTPTQAQSERERCQQDKSAFPMQYPSQWLTHDGQVRSVLCSLNVLENRHFKTIFILSGIDITEWREAEEKIYHLSHFDHITGLPNRAVLRDRLEQAIRRHESHGGLVALLLVELNGLAKIRDAFGAQAGIALTIAVAQRLQSWKPSEQATVTQHSEGVFAVLLEEVRKSEIDLIVQELIQILENSYSIPGQQSIHLQPKIGISIYPNDGKTSETLSHFAEIALHRAQEKIHDHYQFHSPGLNQEIAKRHVLSNQLREAIRQDELVLHYQPQVSLKNGKITGFEALVRWNHPEHGLLMPAEFVSLAEESDLILAVGEWVLRAACLQCKEWERKGFNPVTIAVNLSAMQFTEKNLKGLIGQILSESQMDPQYLELELTESVSMDDPEKSIAIMVHLRKLGVTLSIDDFGTGYSNLSYLKRFPVGRLKIDKSFVRDLVDDPHDLAICRSIIAIAKSLHLEVVAEGVETANQLKILHAEGCDKIQGYYFSVPLPAKDCISLLERDISLPLDSIRRSPYARSLLVVDDEVNILAAIKRVLSRSGYQIFTANNAAEAFDILANHQIGVVLTDQQMPDVLGTELLEKVRFMYPNTVRIMLTGHASLNSVTHAINQGAIYKFLVKPWDNDELEKTILGAFEKFEAALK
ncbi:EAL domain-containing protein [Herbaspirillum sp. RV1423]|uniref:EAL domain-containing protein n=1 Tax=Herbaspirillum sp. RV1423 TaxID=1443993 RepID=UPI0004BA5F88|nr:EAL domain-containing protein [Herbaspirillum sp. RV1423]